MKKRREFNLPHKQTGYILIVSLVLLGAMLLATVSYFERSADSIQMSGYSRDSAEALLLAESALNKLHGQFNFNHDIDGDNIIDKNESFNENDLDALPLFYMYYVSGNAPATISETQPSILQKIADGEARSANRSAVTVSNHRVPSGGNNLVINELFTNNNTLKPIMYTLNNNNELTVSNSTWSTALSNNDKVAAAWLELIRSPSGDGTVHIYAQAVAQVGRSKNYIQRFAGIYPNTLGSIFTLTQSR